MAKVIVVRRNELKDTSGSARQEALKEFEIALRDVRVYGYRINIRTIRKLMRLAKALPNRLGVC